jgi:hypothetical protein
LLDLYEKVSGPLTMKGGFEKILLFPDLITKLNIIKPDIQNELKAISNSKPVANLH